MLNAQFEFEIFKKKNGGVEGKIQYTAGQVETGGLGGGRFFTGSNWAD